MITKIRYVSGGAIKTLTADFLRGFRMARLTHFDKHEIKCKNCVIC